MVIQCSPGHPIPIDTSIGPVEHVRGLDAALGYELNDKQCTVPRFLLVHRTGIA